MHGLPPSGVGLPRRPRVGRGRYPRCGRALGRRDGRPCLHVLHARRVFDPVDAVLRPAYELARSNGVPRRHRCRPAWCRRRRACRRGRHLRARQARGRHLRARRARGRHRDGALRLVRCACFLGGSRLVSGFEFRVLGFGFRISDFGFQVSGFGSRGSGFRNWGLRFKIWCLGSGIWGLCFRV